MGDIGLSRGYEGLHRDDLLIFFKLLYKDDIDKYTII